MQTKFTKNNIIEHLKGDNVGLSDSNSKNLLNEFFSVLEEEMKLGSNVKFYGFGTFKAKTYKQKKARNIKTGEEILVPECQKLSFIQAKKGVSS